MMAWINRSVPLSNMTHDVILISIFKLIPEIPCVHILVIPWRSLSGLRIIYIDAQNLAAHILITAMHIRA